MGIGMFFLKLMGKTHVSLYRLTGGFVGGSFRGAPVLLLSVTGRKTGKRRTTPLLFLRDGESLVVVGSNGGRDWDPQWLRNLEQNLEAEVRIKSSKIAVRAEKAGPSEKERLWPMVAKMFPSYDDYRKRTTRDIPLVILTPAGANRTASSN